MDSWSLFFLDGAMLDIVRLSLVSGFSNWCCQHLFLEFIVFEGFCLHALKDANNLAQDNSWSMTRFWKGKPTAEHLSKYFVCVTIIDSVKTILGPTECGSGHYCPCIYIYIQYINMVTSSLKITYSYIHTHGLITNPSFFVRAATQWYPSNWIPSPDDADSQRTGLRCQALYAERKPSLVGQVWGSNGGCDAETWRVELSKLGLSDGC